jgi:hypothetical protein
MPFNYQETFGNLNNAQANIFLVKFDKRSPLTSWARLLPDTNNFYGTMLNSYGRYLHGFHARELEQFNPVGNTGESLPTLAVGRIQENWDAIQQLINYCRNLNANEVREINEGEENLIVTEIEADGQTTFFISKYSTATKWFRHKNVFLREEGRLIQQDTDNLIAINYNIDVAISNGTAYLFSVSNFKSIFSYDEHLQAAANALMPAIQNWNIVGNMDVFLSFATNKYFYQGIAKIADDAAYLAIIQNFDPQRLRARLLQCANAIFSPADFNADGRFVVTRNNCKNIIKMIAKEFKYNVFLENLEA